MQKTCHGRISNKVAGILMALKRLPTCTNEISTVNGHIELKSYKPVASDLDNFSFLEHKAEVHIQTSALRLFCNTGFKQQLTFYGLESYPKRFQESPGRTCGEKQPTFQWSALFQSLFRHVKVLIKIMGVKMNIKKQQHEILLSVLFTVFSFSCFFTYSYFPPSMIHFTRTCQGSCCWFF